MLCLAGVMRGTFLLLLFITLPVSVILWLSNAFLSSVIGGSVIEPSRWLSATLFPLVVAWWGLRKGSISFSGAICGLVVGFLLTLGSYAFFINLLVFFVSSSKATKYKSTLKRKTEANFKEDCGCGENPVDLIYNYRCSWLSVAVLGALACCNGDTWASELGAVLSFGDPVLITNLHSVPRGNVDNI